MKDSQPKLTKLKSVKLALVYPFKQFVKANSLGGNLLLLSLIIGLVWANSGYQDSYHALWSKTYAGISLGNFSLEMSLQHWINDGLMAIFFFLVGLEIKREMLAGELSVFRKAIFPVAAAFGGMVAPAVLFLLFQSNSPETVRGWAIPTATDIAFVLGVLSLLGDKVPISLKIFLTALAIVDDIGAILLIGLFYSTGLNLNYLLVMALILLVMFALNRFGVRNLKIYLFFAFLLWYIVFSSGIHATLAGVLAALTIPVKGKLCRKSAAQAGTILANELNTLSHSPKEILADGNYHSILSQMSKLYKQASTPLQRMEHRLHSLVSYFILPLFALANGGITIDFSMLNQLLNPLSLGIIAGLCLGKPLGIVSICWSLEKMKLAERPNHMSWQQLWASGCFAGIGFTMSIFIAGLAFDNILLLNQAKLSIIVASLMSTLLGIALLLNARAAEKN